MGDKKVLNNKELENISSGTTGPEDTCRLYCACCHTYVKENVPLDRAESLKEFYETIHICPSGNKPRILIEY